MGLGPSTGYRGVTVINDTQPKACANAYKYLHVHVRLHTRITACR